MARVLVTGARGMLGTALLARTPPVHQAVGLDLPDGDLSEPAVALGLLTRYKPALVIHCAAMTNVDACTRDPELAYRHNAVATANLAHACRPLGARLIYLSTDYVFSGDLGRPYRELDAPQPLNAYGQSKLAGEHFVTQLDNHLVVRSQWLYGPDGKNFVATIVEAARTRDTLRVVADEFGSPTYTYDLAEGLWQLAFADVTGLLHLTNSGHCSWAELAALALRTAGLSTTIEPISAADWDSPTVRPAFSVLANQRWAELGYAPLRPWSEAVSEYVTGNLRT
jgi:dTDP-4-dehydrorhamnose reductase